MPVVLFKAEAEPLTGARFNQCEKEGLLEHMWLGSFLPDV